MNTLIIDTREPAEYAISHMDGAINLSSALFSDGKLPELLSDRERSDEIILYCRSGMRSNTVGHILECHGFTNIVNGINEHHVAKLLSNR